MKFVVFADGTANLPKSLLADINLLPCSYQMDEEPCTYNGDVEEFDGPVFYEGLKEGKKVKTTLLNTYLFVSEFKAYLEKGMDVLYVSMSSGISGTFNAARLSVLELENDYPERKVVIIDSLGCGFGSGLLAMRAANLARQDKTIEEVENILKEEVPHICQYFTVDDLDFLRATGRVSGVTAKIATIMNIKPILYGNEEGQIVSRGKVKGRKAAIEELINIYKEKAEDNENYIVCISHGNCADAAESLKEKIEELDSTKKVVVSMHEPFSGSHVGPGMLGLFFYGKER